MIENAQLDRKAVIRWVRTMPAVFVLLGLSFGTWLSRLPALRDHLDASTVEMSLYGLCLAAGSVIGLIFSGQVVQRFGTKRTLIVNSIGQFIALPVALAIILNVSVPLGLVVLFIYGFGFAIADVAMNVSGAGAERAFGKARMPLMHAGYSTGTVAAMGLGALAEQTGIDPLPHFIAVFAALGLALIFLMRAIPSDNTTSPGAGHAADSGHERAGFDATGSVPVVESASGQQPAFTTMTGSIPVVAADAVGSAGAADSGERVDPGAHAPVASRAPKRYSPWRDARVLLIGTIALAAGLLDGTAADWLPLALVDGRGVSNEAGALMLAIFFASILVVRVAGSALLNRFGRVALLRASAVTATIGIVTVIVLPGPLGLVLGTVLWGLGSGLGWPIAISASADRRETAVHDVAAVSAIGYGSMLVGPMAFGLLGEFIGLLNAFWALLAFTVLIGLIAHTAREPGSTRTRNR